jgi:hypothetical protein
MTAEDLEGLLNKKVIGVGYEETFHGCYLVIIIKNHEYYLRSDTPIELDLRDIH